MLEGSMMSKQLLVEHIVVAPNSVAASKSHTAAYIVESSGSRLKVKLPATTLDVKNENQRVYSTTIMESACRNASDAFKERSLLSSVNEHPAETPYVTPGQASHIVTNAWCEDGYLMNEWEILDTAAGRDLRALVEAQAAFGVSIRGMGSIDNYGNIQDDYEYLGTDCVAQPSARIRTAPQVVESTRNRQSNTPIVEGKTAMDLRQYVREQITLLKAEPNKVDAFKRAAAVETALSESKSSGRELADAYREWETGKNQVFESAAAEPDADKKLIEAVEAHRRSTKLFRRVMADTTTRISALEARTADAAAKLVKERSRGDAAVTMAKSLQAKLDEATKQLEALQSKYDAAVKIAAEHKLARSVAVTEAARQVAKYRHATRIAAHGVVENARLKKQPKPVTAPTTPVVSTGRNGNAVSESSATDARVVRTIRDPHDGTLRETKHGRVDRSRAASDEQPHQGWF